ncbi:MAG: hypothetical protein PVI90_00310 [Desulfobacteraceae bacterium]|jgi:hypothetical protein
MKNPHFRVHAALAAMDHDKKVSDPKIATIINAIEGQNVSDAIKYAWEQYAQENIRIILDALLLGGATFSLIQQVTDIPINVLQAYCDYFFDISVFRNRLERYNYVTIMRNHVTPREAMLLETAITGGPEVLLWLLSPGKKTLKHTPVDVLEIMMTENMYKAISARTAPLTSPTAKIGLECSKTAIQAAANLQKLNPTDDIDALAELKLTLTYQDNSISPNTLGAPAPKDILH